MSILNTARLRSGMAGQCTRARLNRANNLQGTTVHIHNIESQDQMLEILNYGGSVTLYRHFNNDHLPKRGVYKHDLEARKGRGNKSTQQFEAHRLKHYPHIPSRETAVYAAIDRTHWTLPKTVPYEIKITLNQKGIRSTDFPIYWGDIYALHSGNQLTWKDDEPLEAYQLDPNKSYYNNPATEKNEAVEVLIDPDLCTIAVLKRLVASAPQT